MKTSRPFGHLAALIAISSLALGCSPCEPGPGVICTIVGTGEKGFLGDGADARDAELYLPMDTSIGPDGRLFVVDWNNHRIRAVDASGRIETVAGNGLLGDGPTGPALEAAFNHPTNVVFDERGRMWIAAWHNSRIRLVDLDTGRLEHVCGTGARAYAGDDGPAETAVLDLPAGIAFDPEGRLLIVDQANQVIRRIDPSTGNISRVAGMCVVDDCEDGQTPQPCPDNDRFACGLDEDPSVCDLPCLGAFDGDGGPALEARFSMPFGQSADPAGRVAVDAAGRIFLADSRNHRVRMIDEAGVVHTYAGNGDRGFAGEGGLATEAELNNPVDLAFDEDGTLYIADTFNSCVRAVSTDGIIRTVAGVCGERGFGGDGGPPEAALLDRPYGIDVHAGRLYITDTHNDRIRAVDL